MNDERKRVVVVGGGAIGLAVAWELVRREQSVLLLERSRAGSGSTWAAGGMLAPVSEAELEPAELIEFGRESAERYPGMVSDLEKESGVDCGYRTEGTLWVAATRDDAEELTHLEAKLGERGLAVQRLDAASVREREPHLSARVLGGLSLADDHQIDPRRLVRALDRAIRSRGGRIVRGAQVSGVQARDGQVTGVTGRADDGPFEVAASDVIVATGAWTDQDLGLPSPIVGVRPVKGQLLRLAGSPLLDRVVRTPDVYLIPRRDGELLVGATMEEVGFSTEATAGAVLDLLRHAWEVLPGIYDLELREVSVGLRSAVEDHLPVIGPTRTRGLWLALGHYRNGILLAPGTGHHLADWIVAGRRPAALAAFDPGRLEELPAESATEVHGG